MSINYNEHILHYWDSYFSRPKDVWEREDDDFLTQRSSQYYNCHVWDYFESEVPDLLWPDRNRDDGTGGPDDNDDHVWAYHNRDEDHHECDSDECCKVDDDDTFDALFVVWAYLPGSVRNKGFDCPASARLERDMLMAAGVYAEIEDCTINPYGG
jgi:hypothetical protein